MKYLYTSILLFIITFFCTSCENEFANIQTIPYAQCDMLFNPTASGQDAHLNSPYHIGVYIPKADQQKYESQLSNITPNHSFVKTYSTPRGIANQYYGYSGVLVINRGSSGFNAYDLCCPNESSRSARVVPTKDYKAVCPRCNSTYDLDSGGVPLSGPAKEKKVRLQPYTVISSGEGKYRVIH